MHISKLSLTCAGLLMLCAVNVQPATIHVPADQPTIQDGVDAADPGDTILISAGTYYENVVVNRRLSLIGQFGHGMPVVDGGNSGNVLLISASGVTVRYLNFRHSGSTQEPDGLWDAGVHILRADSCKVIGCVLANNGAAGLSLAHSSHCTIRHCMIGENGFGIYFYEASGEEPDPDNSQNVIDSNIVCYQAIGIRFTHTAQTYHRANIISANYIAYNTSGLSMIMSEKNEVFSNQFLGNTGTAILLMQCTGGGDSNRFYLNYIADNGSGSEQCAYISQGPDFWYSEDYEMGNYWSDYEGEDLDHDGIGDWPYFFMGRDDPYGFDGYPLMSFPDSDDDDFVDYVDNCILTANPTQRDTDMDGIGDACCCSGHTGDVDCNHDRDLADITTLIDHVYLTHCFLCCPASGNTSGDQAGDIDLADITSLIDLVYISHDEVAPCP